MLRRKPIVQQLTQLNSADVLERHCDTYTHARVKTVLLGYTCFSHKKGKKEVAVDLYSAFIVVPHIQGAHTDHTLFTCKLHRKCLYFVSVRQMAPPQTEVADI